jgi:hypothetical protein
MYCILGAGDQILDQIETICSQHDKFGNDTKTFWFRFQNDIGTFVLSFLTSVDALLICPLSIGFIKGYFQWPTVSLNVTYVHFYRLLYKLFLDSNCLLPVILHKGALYYSSLFDLA